MTHILRSDFYKLRKARYFWVCLAVTVILAVGSVFLLDFTYRLAGDQMETQVASQQETLEESGVSVSVEGVPLSYDELSGSGQLLSFFAGNTTLILAVLISLFVGSEFNHGTIKNMASRQYSRAALYGFQADHRHGRRSLSDPGLRPVRSCHGFHPLGIWPCFFRVLAPDTRGSRT